ncbi:MAG: tRNA 2-selenouridine(34) synthase MnmH [Anaerolineae bacterium]|nr:tRNA 2-selenouridine(34) synthase MnmH [Anaerolineae bacterium]
MNTPNTSPESKKLDVEAFLDLGQRYPIIDVRTPAEYDKGHIPGAINIPLFSNEERAMIGTLYKQVGQNEAMLLGLDLVGPKMRGLIEQVQAVAVERTVLFHCWRGGMRSESVAWLVGLFGYQTYTLQRGYKGFRNYVLQTLATPRQIFILGGKTGSGKTEILRELQQRGQQIIDLEALAHHKGSAFGALGEACQPTQQQFEHELAERWRQIDPQRPVWLEDESRNIGYLSIPLAVWQQMQQATTLFVEVPALWRNRYLVEEYGRFPLPALKDAVERLQKRLGRRNMQTALNALEANDLTTCCDILLRHYYDKTYVRSLSRRDAAVVHHIELDSIDPARNADHLLAFVDDTLPHGPISFNK